MEINNIVDDSQITSTVRQLYKFIDTNEEKFNEIFEIILNDLTNQFMTVERQSKNTIVVEAKNAKTANKIYDMVYDCIKCHVEKNVPISTNNLNIVNYIFKVTVVNNRIIIMKKR